MKKLVSMWQLSTNGIKAGLWTANLFCHKPTNVTPPVATVMLSFAANKLTLKGRCNSIHWSTGILFHHAGGELNFVCKKQGGASKGGDRALGKKA